MKKENKLLIIILIFTITIIFTTRIYSLSPLTFDASMYDNEDSDQADHPALFDNPQIAFWISISLVGFLITYVIGVLRKQVVFKNKKEPIRKELRVRALERKKLRINNNSFKDDNDYEIIDSLSALGWVEEQEEELKEVETRQIVYFSVYAPYSISPDSNFTLCVWAYLLKQKLVMEEIASMDYTQEKKMQKGPVLAKKGDRFQIKLELPFPFEVKDDIDSIYWLGEVTNATFSVFVPESIRTGTHSGQIKVFNSGIQILKIDFVLKIGEGKSNVIDSTQNVDWIKDIFASYTREDQLEVLQRVQGIQALGINVFLDHISIRQGEYWKEKIHEFILKSDLFLLFWSEAASRSKWVSNEWKFALEKRGLDFIQPIPLNDAEKIPPPKELASKHFSDLILIYLKSLENKK